MTLIFIVRQAMNDVTMLFIYLYKTFTKHQTKTEHITAAFPEWAVQRRGYIPAANPAVSE